MSSPYSHPVTHITDVSKYFLKDEKTFSMKFIGESLELRIPMKFKRYGMLEVGESVTTLGVMDMIFDGQYQCGLNILASITIEPSDMSKMTYEGVEYLVLYLKQGDVFMTSYRVIKNTQVVFVIWKEFIESGGTIYTLNYEDLLKIFDNVRELTGQGIGVSRSVWAGIVAHLARDPNNISTQYRLTDMKEPMNLVPLNSISQAPSGTLARLNGSYFRNAGMDSALRHQVDKPQPFEDILRGISTSSVESTPDAIL